MTLTSNQMFERLTQLIAPQMYITQSAQIEAASIEVDFLKTFILQIPLKHSIRDCQIINLPSLCFSPANASCQNRVLTRQVISFG